MKKITPLILLTLFELNLGVLPIVYGQPRVLTYEEAINIALNQSHTVKSYSEQKQAMQFYFNYYEAMFKPRIDFQVFSPSFSENVTPIARPDGLPVYNSTGFLQYGGNLAFTYILPTGGNFALNTMMYREDLKTVLALNDYQKLTTEQARTSISLNFRQPIFTRNLLRENLNEAKYNFDIASSQFTRQQMDIIYQVTEGFYALYKATREVEIAKERFKNSEEAYRIARLRGETGRIPEGDVLISEIERAQNRANVFASESNLESTKDAFKQLIGLNMNEEISILTDLQYDTFQINLSKAIEQGLKNRLEMTEAELNIELQQIQVDRAKRVREFSGEITAYYDITGVSTLGSGSLQHLFESSFDNFDDRPHNRGVTLTFSYPIFDWGRGSSRVQQESATLREQELYKENLQTTIIREIRDNVRSVEEAKNRLQIQERNQEVAQRSYRISQLRFENGDITSQELGVEQARLAETQLDYLNAFITYQLAVADLKRKTMWDFKNDRSYLMDDYFQREE